MTLLHWYVQLWELNPTRAIWCHIVLLVLAMIAYCTQATERDLDYGSMESPHIHTFDPVRGETRYDEVDETLYVRCNFPNCQKWLPDGDLHAKN